MTGKLAAAATRATNRRPVQRVQTRVASERAMPALLGLKTEAPMLRRQCACGGTCPRCAETESKIQARLEVGAVDDPQERAADDAAAQVMRGQAPRRDALAIPDSSCQGRRSAAAGRHGDEAHEDERIDANELTRGGTPLSADLRQFFEPRFGRDLRHVRLHAGPAAERRAAALRAQAFAYGAHIWLGRGQSAGPSWLVAHELAHVLQQTDSSTVRPRIRRLPAGCPDDPDNPPLPEEIDFRSDEALKAIRESIFERDPLALRLGDEGESVVLVQDLLLNELCTGIDRLAVHEERNDLRFGPATRKAVKLYQQTHNDLIGRPLSPDGRVGPLTLGTMDDSLGIRAIPPARAPEGKGECFGVAEQGPGEAQRLLAADVPPFPDFHPNDVVWEVSNFDVAKHFVKTEHRAFLRSDVVPVINALPAASARVRILGEASTTASPDFNQPLSERRAHCVKAALIDAGLDGGRIDEVEGRGEWLTRVRRILAGATPLDDVEDRAARKVSIILAPATTAECSAADKTRGSTKFVAQVACESAFSVRVDIGDRSDPARPIYREFRLTHLPWPQGCLFLSGAPVPLLTEFTTPLAFHLARRDPDRPDAPSEFTGRANADSAVTMTLKGLVNPFEMPLRGLWIPLTCGDFPSSTPGWLNAIGPVHCGDLPEMPESKCLPGREEDCPEDYKFTAAQHYRGVLFGGSADVSRILPAWLRDFVPLGAAGAVAAFSTTDLPGPQLMRFFVYLGGSLSGAGSGLDRLAAAYAGKIDVGKAVQLQTRPDGIRSRIRGHSDFSKMWNAELTLNGGSNRVDLETGEGTFGFFGPLCRAGASHTYHGVLRSAGGAFCGELPDVSIPERDCKDEADCPEATRLAGHRHFRIRVGRMTSFDMPPGLADRAAAFGCQLTAARLAIDTDAEEGGPIHREFILLMKHADCAFAVARADVEEDFVLERQLAISEPDKISAPSDFIGAADLDASGELTIVAGTHWPITIDLPGTWDAKCSGARSALGAVVPVSVVDCGLAREPAHDSRPEPDHAARCNAFKAANPALVGDAVLNLKGKVFDRLVAVLGRAPRVIVPPLDYEGWLRTHKPGDTIANAFFVGKAPGPDPLHEIPVVAFADIRILAINTNRTMVIQFITDLCAFDENGQVVLLRPAGCADNFARAGSVRRVGTIIVGSDPSGGSGPVKTAQVEQSRSASAASVEGVA